MTDRLKGVYVAFETEIRVDDAEAIIGAIKQIRGVLSVEEDVAHYDHYTAHQQAIRTMRTLIWDALDDENLAKYLPGGTKRR